jgi:hypothetical protein
VEDLSDVSIEGQCPGVGAKGGDADETHNGTTVVTGGNVETC